MQPDRPPRYHAFRHRALGVILVLMVALAVPRMWAAGHGQAPFFLAKAKSLLIASLWICVYGYIWWQARRAARAEKLAGLAAGYQPGPPKPTFLWQAILILLPVALMAAFGFWAILQERNAVAEEARQRAQAILQSLPRDFDRLAANRLTQFDVPNNGWLYHLRAAQSAWPGNQIRKQWPADTNVLHGITNNLALLHSAWPQWLSGPFPRANFELDTNGDLLYGQPLPPRPPAWLATLSPAQYTAWTALQAASCAQAPLATLTNLDQVFRETKPPAPALACADFWLLRARLADRPATNAVRQLLDFAGQYYRELSDSGVPLRTLALADAVNQSRAHEASQQLWEALRGEVDNPGALTPRILDQAADLVARDQQLTDAIQALRLLLANNLAQAELAHAIKVSGQFHPFTPASFWLSSPGQRWFFLLNPTTSVMHGPYSHTTTNLCVAVAGYPLPLVARGFADALVDAQVSLPDYFSVALNLQGEAVPLPQPWNKTGPGQPSGELLAEAPFALSQLAGGPGVDIRYETMPSHPPFTLQIRLTDRHLLSARQRQLQYIFGTLIGVSAAAALVGFIAAYRAFRRQQELSEAKSNFVSSVSHELRAPIASVRLMAENLASGKIPAAAKQQEYFKFIVQECRRLSSLIENVLDFSRIEQGRKQYEMESTDLAALVQSTVKLLEPYASEKGVNLRLGTSHPPAAGNLEATVDGRAIQQALVNLIDNAIKHSPAGQTVSVALMRWESPSAPAIHVSVTDQGPGIPAAEQEKIFERFYRRGSELRRETQGIGIGLSLVKHIMEAHGGRVTVQSEPGHGSRFTLEIPLHASPPAEGRIHE